MVQTEMSKHGVAVVRLANPPVNILTGEMADEIVNTFGSLAADFETKAVVLTSAKDGVFSAGLNINEIVDPKKGAFTAYWEAIIRMFVHLYKFPKPLVVGVNGAAPAGGCMLSLCGDSRIMSNAHNGKYRIGLNEVHLGFPPPLWLCDAYRACVRFDAERHLKFGMLLQPSQAKEVGLVDEVVNSDDEVLQACIAEAERWKAIPFTAFETAKLGFRMELLSILEAEQPNILEQTWDMISSPDTQQVVKAYMAKLKK